MKFILSLMTMFCLALVGFCSTASAQIGGKKFTQEYVYDFAKHGGAVSFISLTVPANKLPLGSIVTSVHYRIVTAFTSGGAATVALGSEASAASYLAATAYNNGAYALDNVAAAAIGVPNLIATTEGNFGITVAGAALTAGKVMFVVEGYVPRQ